MEQRILGNLSKVGISVSVWGLRVQSVCLSVCIFSELFQQLSYYYYAKYVQKSKNLAEIFIFSLALTISRCCEHIKQP